LLDVVNTFIYHVMSFSSSVKITKYSFNMHISELV